MRIVLQRSRKHTCQVTPGIFCLLLNRCKMYSVYTICLYMCASQQSTAFILQMCAVLCHQKELNLESREKLTITPPTFFALMWFSKQWRTMPELTTARKFMVYCVAAVEAQEGREKMCNSQKLTYIKTKAVNHVGSPLPHKKDLFKRWYSFKLLPFSRRNWWGLDWRIKGAQQRVVFKTSWNPCMESRKEQIAAAATSTQH